MVDFKGKRILWVDDQIKHLKPYSDVLKSNGLIVDTAEDIESVMTLAENQSYDLFLVDLRIPSPDGIAILRKLHRLDNQEDAIFAAYSSYLYEKKYKEKLRGLEFKVKILDKDFPPIDSEEITNRFINPIGSLFNIDDQTTIHEIEKRVENRLDIDPFGIEIDEFLSLSMHEKEALQDAAGEIAMATIENEFQNGKIWVLLCGSSSDVRKSAEIQREILDQQRILDFARRVGYAPYQFFTAPVVEDMGWNCCGHNTYPTVTIEIFNDEDPSDDTSENMTVHFDTGCPICLLSYEAMLENRIIKSVGLIGDAFVPKKRKGYKKIYKAINLDLDGLIECQETKATKKVKLSGQIIREWEKSPYARTCQSTCPYNAKKEKTHNGICFFREEGLIGRNILTENGISIILDGKNRLTKLGNGDN